MLRIFYVLLLHLHPAAFRQRFGDEMLQIFDNADGFCLSIMLMGDGLLSLIRQWTLRPEFRQPLLAPVASDRPADVLLFRTIDPYAPRRSAILSGGLLAIAVFGGLATVVNQGRHAWSFLIGVHDSTPHLLPVARASVTGADLNTTVKVGSRPEDPWRAIASVYFKIIRVLDVLDSDKDLVLSPWEIFTAPAALRRLDTNHDGKLSADECGFFMDANSRMPPDAVERARRAFMRDNPVLAALDTDHDGEISAAEIAGSNVALKKLDRNGDGSLTPDELIPDQPSQQAAMIMFRLDANDDGRISRAEWESDADGPLRDLLQSADRNHDGTVTK